MPDKTLGAYKRHESPDYADGGVTAAQVEKEALSGASLAAHFRDKRDMERARAEKAEEERDEALYQRDQWMRGNDSTRDILDEAIEERRRIARALDLPESADADEMVKRAAVPRPLTPDAISADAYERGVPVLRDAPQKPSVMVAHETVRAIVAAVLTEPPARPEGAEEWDEELGEMPAAQDLTPEQRARLADALAERDHTLGVRVVGEDDEGDETPDVCPHIGGPGGDCGCPL